MGPTAQQISLINRVQVAMSVMSLLIDFNGYLFPEDANINNDDTFDYVVAGSSAGSVVAARLVEAGYSVLILEAGGHRGLACNYSGMISFTKHTRMDWNFTVEEFRDDDSCHKPSFAPFFGKVLGGSSETNILIYSHGRPEDYDEWSQLTDDESWNWENMMEYFKKSEKLEDPTILNSPFKTYHGTDGKIQVERDSNPLTDEYMKYFETTADPIVEDNIGNGNLGYSPGLFHSHQGIRSGVSTAYIAPLKGNNNLQISYNSLVTKIIFDDNNNAVGVEFIKNGQTTTVKARKEVIISAGSIKTPQLLMLSGIGQQDELESLDIDVISDLPVGKHLLVTSAVMLGFKTNKPANPELYNPRSYPSALITGYSSVEKSSKNADTETLNFIYNNLDNLIARCGFSLGFENPICDKLYSFANGNEFMLTILSNWRNNAAKGEIQLKDNNPETYPIIYSGQYLNDEEVMINYMKYFLQIQNASGFQGIGLEFVDPTSCEEFEEWSDEYWTCYLSCMSFTTRYCGSCAMGSVVDNRLRVYGVNRLRVVDASVMPSNVGGVTLGSLVALGERAADIILEDNRGY